MWRFTIDTYFYLPLETWENVLSSPHSKVSSKKLRHHSERTRTIIFKLWNKRMITQDKQRLWGDLSQTGVSAKANEGPHYPASHCSNILSKTAHYVAAGVSVCFPGWELQRGSWNYPAEKRADKLNCCKAEYPYLCVDFCSVHSEPGRGSFCTPVTSTSSSACNLSSERRCRLCSPPGSLGDVWQLRW